MLTQVVCGSFDARYDQVTVVVESDTLERIHDAANAFKLGAKGAYIDVVVGVKAPRAGRRRPPGSHRLIRIPAIASPGASVVLCDDCRGTACACLGWRTCRRPPARARVSD